MQSSIVIRGAREHNLKSIDLDIPRDRLVVITGLSGSGKSSLAFDTVYAEGQRRYVESLSAYARQFLELMQKPDVDSIEGLSPAISIEQKTTSRNPRSTVGTVTEIYDYLRLLFARVGVPYSPATGLPIASQTVSQMVDIVLGMAEGTRLYVLAPIVRGRKGEYRKELADLLKRGFQRVKIDGTLYELEDAPALKKNFKHDIEVVVDRLVVRPDIGSRLADSLEIALDLADGLALAEDAESGERTTFSAKFACPVSGFTIEEIEPRLFSFNNPFGACPACDGLGSQMYVDVDLVVPNERLSLREGAIAPWAKSSSPYYLQTLESLARHCGESTGTPFRDLEPATREAILHGTTTPVEMSYDDGDRAYTTKRPFEGVIPNLERRLRETDSAWIREELARYQSTRTCDTCTGHRLKPEALAVKINQLHISETVEMSITDARRWFAALNDALTPKQREIAVRIPARDQRAPRFPRRRRARLPDPCAQRRHVVGGREPAHPARLADRLGPHRRALRPRRALDRSAPTRQRTLAGDAQAPARSRQHGARGRARRGGDIRGRPCRRHGTGRGRARRPRRRRGDAHGDPRQRAEPDRSVPERHSPDSAAREPAPGGPRPSSEGQRRARQ